MKIPESFKRNAFYRSIFGYDLFISYSRRDSLDYAYNIANHFNKAGFECYIDQLSSSNPGKSLPINIQQALRKSKGLVLIASEGAKQSKPIELEIETFLKSQRNRPIIPVNLNNSIFQATWYPKIEGLAIISENDDHVTVRSPSEAVLSRISNSINFTKKSAALRRFAVGIAVMILGLLVISLFQFSMATKANKMANAAKEELNTAKDSIGEIQQQIDAVNKSLQETKGNLDSLQAANTAAQQELSSMHEQVVEASKAKDSLSDLAFRFRKEAETFETKAFARNLSAQAELQNENNPQFATLLSAHAMNKLEKLGLSDDIVEGTFRRIAGNKEGYGLPGHMDKLRAVSINDNETLLATGDASGFIKIWDVSLPGSPRFIRNIICNDEIKTLTFARNDILVGSTQPFGKRRDTLHVYVWKNIDVSKTPVLISTQHGYFSTVSKDGSLLAVAMPDNTIQLYGMLGGVTEFLRTFVRPDSIVIDDLWFSNTGRYLAADTHDSIAYIWDLTAQNRLPYARIQLPGSSVTGIQFDSADSLFAVATGYTDELEYYIYEVGKWNTPRIRIPVTKIKRLHFDEKKMIVISHDNSIYAIDTRSWLPKLEISMPEEIMNSYYDPRIKQLLIATSGSRIYHIMQTDTALSILNVLPNNSTNANTLMLSPNKNFCISAAFSDLTPYLIPLSKTHTRGYDYVFKMQNDSFENVVHAANGQTFLIAGKKGSSIFQKDSTGKPVLIGEISSPYAPTLSPDGKWLLNVEDTPSETTALYYLNKEIQLRGRIGGTYNTFSPASNYLLSPSDSLALLYNLSPAGAVTPKMKSSDRIGKYDEYFFSPDGLWLLEKQQMDSVTFNGLTRLWYLGDKDDTANHITLPVDEDNMSYFFSPFSDALVAAQYYREDSLAYHLYTFDLYKDGSVQLAAHLDDLKESFNILTIDTASNTMLIKQDGDYAVRTPRNLTDGENEYWIPTAASITDQAFSPDGKWLLVFEDESPEGRLYNLHENKGFNIESHTFTPPFKNSRDFCTFRFTPDGRYLYINSSYEPGIYVYPLNQEAHVLSGFPLFSLDDNKYAQDCQYSRDTLYVLYTNTGKTTGHLYRYNLKNSKNNIPVSLFQSNDYIEQIFTESTFSNLVTAGNSVYSLMTNLADYKKNAGNFVGRNFTQHEWLMVEGDALYQPVFNDLPIDRNIYSANTPHMLQKLDSCLRSISNLDSLVQKSSDPVFGFDIGLFHMRQSEYARAVDAFKRSIDLDEREAAYVIYHALCLGYLNHFEEGLESLKRIEGHALTDTQQQQVELISTSFLNHRMPVSFNDHF